MWLNLDEKENSYMDMHAHFKVENLSRTMCYMGPVYMCEWSERWELSLNKYGHSTDYWCDFYKSTWEWIIYK